LLNFLAATRFSTQRSLGKTNLIEQPIKLPDGGAQNRMHVMSNLLHTLLTRASGAARRFVNDKKGVAAVEFVFIAPLIITLWLGTMEISQGVDINKKVGRSASVIGDLVAQFDNVLVGDLDDMLKIGASVLQPYNRGAPTITVSEVYVDASLSAKIVWSRRATGNMFGPGESVNSAVALPANMKIADTYLVKVQTDLKYYPVTSWSIKKNTNAGQTAVVPMSEIYYLRPRLGNDVSCTGC
jgi:Flp pilus assembly protein TadG